LIDGRTEGPQSNSRAIAVEQGSSAIETARFVTISVGKWLLPEHDPYFLGARSSTIRSSFVGATSPHVAAYSKPLTLGGSRQPFSAKGAGALRFPERRIEWR
jgi:hypothetical protein